MCLILLAYRHHPQYPVVMLSNRDEFYQRPTQQAHHWPDAPQVLAGRDQQAGGTWLGVNRSGRFAAVTNFREPLTPPAGLRSRGELTQHFLTGHQTAAEYLQAVLRQQQQYAGFNLLVGDQQQLHYCSNRGAAARPLAAGIYGLSNGLLDSNWPKVSGGKQALAQQLAQSVDIDALLHILVDSQTPADKDLPNTGVGLAAERTLGSRFIQTPNYGTRTSSLLLINHRGRIELIEQHYNQQGQTEQRVVHAMDSQ